MTFESAEVFEPNPEFSLLKTKAIPEDMIEITPENEGAPLAKLWQSFSQEHSMVYLEVLEPKVCVEIWKKPSVSETAWLSFFVTRFENSQTDAFVVGKGIYQLAMEEGDPDDLGSVHLELYLQP